jgi:hypothetical protein
LVREYIKIANYRIESKLVPCGPFRDKKDHKRSPVFYLTFDQAVRNFKGNSINPTRMKSYIYLSATPESLVASHLPPVEFGNYLAVGTRKRTRGQSIFFELDPEKLPALPKEYLEKRLVPYENGEPKRSLFLSIYRVLENTPLEAFRDLYLGTDDGKVLALKPSTYKETGQERIHLYQQFNPITTRVASKLNPLEFINFLTDAGKPVHAPRIFFAELKLNRLARHADAPIHDLPYPNPDHLRECISRLMQSPERLTKTVIRQFRGELPYRTIRDGFFVGDQDNYLFYPFPSDEELEGAYYTWWRSALIRINSFLHSRKRPL